MTNESSTLAVHEVDSLAITTIIDNYLDHFLLETHPVMRRPLLSWDDNPLAEHGLSLLVEVEGGGKSHTVLLDTGLSSLALLHNMDVLQVPLDRIESIFLSHGHMDHIGGLMGLLGKLGRPVDLVSHPGAYCTRRLNLPGKGPQKELPALDAPALRHAGAHILTVPGPALWCSDMLLTLGHVERVTDFERGFPWAEIRQDGAWDADPFIDDQALVFHVRGKGLVIVSGCAHSGIINTVRYARKVTGIDTVYAVMGGFHLTGPLFEPIIGQTVAQMQSLAPTYLIPMHCTGWKSMQAFAAAMPDQFLMSSLGTRFQFA